MMATCMNDIMFSVLIQAPYTLFIELMYQNLKTLIDPVSVQDKGHIKYSLPHAAPCSVRIKLHLSVTWAMGRRVVRDALMWGPQLLLQLTHAMPSS